MQSEATGENGKILVEKEIFKQGDTPRMYLDSVQMLRNQGDFEDALKINKKATEIQPDNSEAYIGWMTTCFGSGRIDEGYKQLIYGLNLILIILRPGYIKHLPKRSQATLK